MVRAALAPQAALGHAVRLLEARCFAVSDRNERGDSFYLRSEETRLAIRVSSHARRAKQRHKHPDVATSIVIATPKTREQIKAMVEAALRMAARQAAALP